MMTDKGKYALGLVLIIAVAFLARGLYESKASPLLVPVPPALVNPNAVQIIEYSDFKCPYCGRAAGTVRQLQDSYGDKIEVTFKHFPLPFHAGADKAAEASECARDQGRFWEYHDRLFSDFARGVDIGKKDALKKIASDLGLEAGAFNECLDSGSKKSSFNSRRRKERVWVSQELRPSSSKARNWSAPSLTRRLCES